MLKRSVICLAALLLVGCGTGGSGDTSANDTAARSILATYQVPGMLAQAGPIISDSLKANLPAQVGEQDRGRLQKAVRQAYEPDKLMADLVKRLQTAAGQAGKSDYLTQAAKTLDADLPRRMIALEDAAASDEFAEGLDKFMDQPPPKNSEPRMRHVQNLADNLQLVKLQIGFNAGMLRGMVQARNAAAPKGYATSDKVMQQMIEQTRNDLHKSLQDQLPVMLFYAYRDVPDKSVADYAQLQSRPALQWVNEQIALALEQTLAAAADRVEGRYRALKPEQTT